ncbi:hypothetical protein C1J03_11710 [Sulfitobacter sp. SK012]|uniref:DUF3604 domain-containing protein n=1 Tax=Sulfitobacter sp. SK012 TaxID=1389005 RepID=UPI000E0B6A04|nr:DUF3604 domain-containing protein [Sulfitobacter sp. SK012]AXI46626.1 hypothetical protein C1J03_11710 [Sulfitobacter sp. SK012]
MMKIAFLTASALVAATFAAHAQEGSNPLRNAYFGETHMHTALSLDAYIGGARLMPSDSLRFAKGESVLVNGQHKQLRRPLDFAAVTDHVEYLGEMYSTIFPDAPGHQQDDLIKLRGLQSLEEKQQWFFKYVVSNNRGDNPSHPPFYMGPETTASGWQIIIDAAEEHNDPGAFTALIGFEWSAAPGGGNMHRNVIFRDNKVPALPLSSYDTNKVEELWQWMQKTTDEDGATLLAIPHNSNASKGQMFPEVDSYGNAIDLEYATARNTWEPLIEMMQIKANSEVHRSFWTADEFADFENGDTIQKNSDRWFSKRDFVREGLKIGLAYEQELGTNPFQLGFIGGTDNHNGLTSDVAEDDFIGGHGPEDGSVERRRKAGVGGWIDGVDLSIGSIAGVWATENTRAAIWDAMKRRETFATSGPRLKVRMFGGADLNPTVDDPVAMVEDGYSKGVPMGGMLEKSDNAPTFTLYAEKDADGANLDRIQVIKGWVTASGETQEKIIDVVWAGDRARNDNGALPPIGNTVDLTTALYTNDIGSATLVGSWSDPDFDPDQHAFYYARALEIPTPRWTTYDAVRNGLPLLPEVPATIQERAWTSPIWYSPN